ncbi:MAG: general secretion pathway protein L [Paraglaciecola sp.]|jgi:general secretion pathway protein L
MEQLVVRLGSGHNDVIHWIVWSTQLDEVIASGELPGSENLATLGDRAGQRPITVLVPTSDVLLKWVSLPSKASRKALSAIPFILEDEISGDIALQFFALGPKRGGEQAVAVVSKEKLHSWLEIIHQAGLDCDTLLPDVLALPQAQKGWALLQLGQHLLIRQDQWSGLQGEKNWLIQAINHYAKQQASPLNIENHSDLALTDLNNVALQQAPLDMPMKVLAKGASQASFNLLQGEYRPSNKNSGSLIKWRLAAVLAIVALSTTLVDKVMQQQQLSAQRSLLSEQIDGEFKRAFPNAGPYRDLKATMRSKLITLEQGGGGTSMLAMFTQLADAFEQSQVKPATIKFDAARRELRLQAMAANFEALEKFKRLAQASGFVVEQGAINNKDNQVIGALLIRS